MTPPEIKPGLINPDVKKLEAMGRLSAKVSHDINNILGAIEGYSTLILNTLKEDDPLKPDLEEIRRAVARAAALTKALLMFSRKQVLSKKPCDLNAAAERAKEAAAPLNGPGVSVELDLEPGLPALPADQAQLDQLLNVLILNARDAMPTGGLIRLATRAVTLKPEEVRSRDPREAGLKFALLSVKDGGRGMAAETLERIFEPFFTTKPKGQGTGLGLSAVYGAVNQHNGWLTVRTEEGKGTEFQIYLPAAPAI
ncbi:MAG: hypothetical protein A2081_04200 [Elusimicrobia bacterium GWC2_61_19]|nr:MAG: hypothetical protein A2081_04200 [Elusimicrobia bacterium GWC2_61_19]